MGSVTADPPVMTVQDWQVVIAESVQLDERLSDGVVVELRWHEHHPNLVMLCAIRGSIEQVAVVKGIHAKEAFNHPCDWLPKPQELWPS